MKMRAEYEFFLGGQDLEMITIRRLLDDEGWSVQDKCLRWPAKVSVYLDEIHTALAANRLPVLVELTDDVGLLEGNLLPGLGKGTVHIIDHHGPRATKETPTALEQVCQLIEFPTSKWTRELTLIAANDRGGIAAIRDAGATAQEIQEIRRRDKAAQRITGEQEAIGKGAAEAAEWRLNRQLTIVKLAHNRAATVTDALEPEFGGPGYQNLVIFSPDETLFYGTGRVITHLNSQYPDHWCGGDLPERGYWGTQQIVEPGDVIKLVEQAITTKSAKEIVVRDYRLILQWPVLLRGGDSSNKQAGFLESWIEKLTANDPQIGGWKDESSGKRADDDQIVAVSQKFPYEQIVYFHPFVRDFLFGDGKSQQRQQTVSLLTRDDVSGLKVELGKWNNVGVQLSLRVDRIQLYLCKPNVAILVIEVCEPQFSDRPDPVTLDVIQDFQDQMRRLYPPFWWDSDSSDPRDPGLCLRNLEWLDSKGKSIDISWSCRLPRDPNDRSGPLTLLTPKNCYDKFTRLGAEPPVFDHYRWFFGRNVRPVQTQADVQDTNTELFFQQILDERIPIMAYVAVDDPYQISEGDFDRLTFIDGSGSDAYPYQKQFLDARRTRYTYDRFQHAKTRYFCCGYGFVVIGASMSDGKRNGFFLDIIKKHFRQHYFCLGLLAHYQKSALLYFSDELATLAKVLNRKSAEEELVDPQFRRRAQLVQFRFLKFKSRAYFPEVTNQLQGQELYRMWVDVLETQNLFEQVDESSEQLNSVMAELETRQLTRIAAYGVPIGVGLAFASALTSMLQLILEPKDTTCKVFVLVSVVVVSVFSGVVSGYWLKARS